MYWYKININAAFGFPPLRAGAEWSPVKFFGAGPSWLRGGEHCRTVPKLVWLRRWFVLTVRDPLHGDSELKSVLLA